MRNQHIRLAILLVVASLMMSARIDKDMIRKLPRDLRNTWVYVSGGPVAIGESSASIAEGFYASIEEVSNRQYREFLHAMLQTGEEMESFAIRDEGWLEWEGNSQILSSQYSRHPAYDEYPVVNVSLESAQRYCSWLAGSLQKQFPSHEVEVVLPDRLQWIRMSRPKDPHATYAWGGKRLFNAKGCALANYRQISAEQVSYDSVSDNFVVRGDAKESFITPCAAYARSVSGQLNLNGNAAEMTNDGWVCGGSWNSPGFDVRCESAYRYDLPTAEIGFRPILHIRPK